MVTVDGAPDPSMLETQGIKDSRQNFFLIWILISMIEMEKVFVIYNDILIMTLD